MDYLEIERNLQENVKKETLNFKVEFSEAFIFDLKELLKDSKITKNEIEYIIQDVLQKDEYFLTTKEKYLNIIDKKELRLLFKFDKNNRLLKFEHFDYLVPVKEVYGRLNFFDFICELIFTFLVYYEFICKNQDMWENMYFLLVGGILLFLYIKERKNELTGKKKSIWGNKNVIDRVRKWLRSGENLDSSRFFFLVRWLNIWILCMIQISSENNDICYMILNIICVLLWSSYSLKHLFKVFNMSIRMGLIFVIFIIIIGFFSKEDWEFIIIISIIINIMFSEDVQYLSSDSLFKKEIKNMNKNKKKIKETKLKLIFNCILASIYLLVKFTDHSFIFGPILESNSKGENYIIQTLYIGVERIIIIAVFTIIIKSENKYLKKMKNKCLNIYQSFVNYIAIKIYLK